MARQFNPIREQLLQEELTSNNRGHARIRIELMLNLLVVRNLSHDEWVELHNYYQTLGLPWPFKKSAKQMVPPEERKIFKARRRGPDDDKDPGSKPQFPIPGYGRGAWDTGRY
jgi:hypothetical protein